VHQQWQQTRNTGIWFQNALLYFYFSDGKGRQPEAFKLLAREFSQTAFCLARANQWGS